jgi:L-asparaginase
LTRLIIHGGAGRGTNSAARKEIAKSISDIATRAWPTLIDAGSRAAVVHAVSLMENNPIFNAGLGSKLQSDGVARMSASLMDGDRRRFSGVVNVTGLKNPIALCRRLLEERDRVLSGEGANAKWRALGLEPLDVRTRVRIKEWQEKVSGSTGTVGAIALDSAGNLAAATSTGGRGYETVGRVSDTPTVAANFATKETAVTCTGVGEHIVEAGLAVRIATMIEMGLSMTEVSDRILDELNLTGCQAGYIALNKDGEWAQVSTTEAFYWCSRGDGEEEGFWSEA